MRETETISTLITVARRQSNNNFYTVTETMRHDDYNHLNKSWSECVIHPKMKCITLFAPYRCNVTHWLYLYSGIVFRFSFIVTFFYSFLHVLALSAPRICAYKKKRFKTSAVLISPASCSCDPTALQASWHRK